MNEKEALDIIQQYNLHPPKPTKYYYKDPYDDGKTCGSGWRYEYPPVDPKLIDAILERDKNCKPYIPDELQQDEKFNAEMEKRFTDLMNRAKESADSTVEKYRKKNQRLYSMSTKVNGEYLTVIPMQLMTETEFKEKASAASETLQLSNYHIYLHLNEDDKEGCEIFKSFPFHSSSISYADKNAIDNVIRFCDHFSKYSDRNDSEFKEYVSDVCDEVKTALGKLELLATADYLQRIKNYADQRKQP